MPVNRVVEASGAQVVPAVGDPQVTFTTWTVHCCANADIRTRSRVHRELAGELFIERVTP